MGKATFNFKNKQVLITGGAQGIGRQMAKDFLTAQAQVIVWDHNEKTLNSFQKEFQSSMLQTQIVDVSSQSSCEQAAQSLKNPIDILVNNAGILRDRSLFKMSPEEYQAVIETNLNGVFYVTKSLLNSFSQSPQKRIVNVSSLVAIYGGFGQTNYVAAKAGVIGFTKVWSKELAQKGFTVNAIAPGFIETSILKDIPVKIKDKILEKIPAGRLGQPQEISQVCLFLCSEQASYINGAVLEVTGGSQNG